MYMFLQACIDQKKMADPKHVVESLAVLPVYLSGCKRLLVFAGATYTSRLWCVLELFTFLRMGALRSAITLLPLATDAEALEESETGGLVIDQRVMSETLKAFGRFDVRQTRCTVQGDRDRPHRHRVEVRGPRDFQRARAANFLGGQRRRWRRRGGAAAYGRFGDGGSGTHRFPCHRCRRQRFPRDCRCRWSLRHPRSRQDPRVAARAGSKTLARQVDNVARTACAITGSAVGNLQIAAAKHHVDRCMNLCATCAYSTLCDTQPSDAAVDACEVFPQEHLPGAVRGQNARNARP